MYLNRLINEEFNKKRWNLPSRIYSDLEVLQPGVNIYQRDLKGKLERIGYRETDPIRLAGEYTITPSYWDIYLKDFSYPYHRFKGYPLRIQIQEDGTIRQLINLSEHKEVDRAEIEPELLATLFDEEMEDRSWVRLEEVPSHLIDAVLSIEDVRFYGHWGVDPIGMLRAILANLRHAEITQGGSTLTQQLIKNVLSKREKTFLRKLNEIFLALMLETRYTKDQILELYLNEIYLGQRGSASISGVQEAARYYFSKDVPYLSVAESALLAALLKAPNSYSPFQDPQKAKARRDLVLKLMWENGKISEEVYQQAIAEPLPQKAPGLPFMRKRILKQAPYFVDYVVEQLRSRYSWEDLQSRGYKIYTTLDMRSQRLAEKSLVEGLSRLEGRYEALNPAWHREPLQGSLICLDLATGFVRAMVGGRDYGQSQFNRAVQAHRQPGSLFKPFVYLTALDPTRKNPYRLTSVLSDYPLTLKYGGKSWTPENYDGVSHGVVTLQKALERSYNIATVRLALEVGLEKVVEMARRMGIESALEPVPSLPLGVYEVTPLEMVRAYTAFANLGVREEPVFIKHVVDRDGKVIESNKVNRERAVSEEAAYQVHVMLEGVMNRGTGYEARKLGYKGLVAGKTGTTSDFKDGWFIGYTPEYLTLVWVGYDQGESIGLTGSQAALPIWVEFMSQIDTKKDSKTFKTPSKKTILVAGTETTPQLGCNSPPDCVEENSSVTSESKDVVSNSENKNLISTAEASSIPTPETTTQSSGVVLQNFLICGGVQNREPITCGDKFSKEQGKVYAWMKVSVANPPTTLKHIYYHNGHKDREISLPIQYASTRTWSSKDIASGGSVGEWTVAVTNEAGEVLATKTFVVD
jgi:penicillin-binding protein 1B